MLSAAAAPASRRWWAPVASVAEASRSVRSLRDIGALPGIFTTDAKADALLALLRRFKTEATPSYSVMANELAVPEEAVMALLKRLENKGKIHFISRRPPRIMVIEPDTVLPHEGGIMPPREGAYDRFLDVEGQRMRLGRFVADCERRNGRGPSLREMMDFTGFNSAGYVQRMAEMLAEKGLLQYGHGVPTKLTAMGRQYFGLPPAPEPMEQMEQVMEQTKPTVVLVGRRPLNTTVKLLCECLASYKRENDGGSPTYAELARRMGFKGKGTSLSVIVPEAVRRGWLKPREPRTQHNLHFTEKGKAKFMPELVAPPPSPMPDDEAPELTEEAATRAQISIGDTVVREATGSLTGDYAEPRALPTFEPAPEPTLDMGLAHVPTAELMMELVGRGYTVRKN